MWRSLSILAAGGILIVDAISTKAQSPAIEHGAAANREYAAVF